MRRITPLCATLRPFARIAPNARIAPIAPDAPNAPNAAKPHPLVLVKKVKKAKAAAIKPQ
jgi:hypothetical protein